MPDVERGEISTPVSVRGDTLTTTGRFGHIRRLGAPTCMGVNVRGLVEMTC